MTLALSKTLLHQRAEARAASIHLMAAYLNAKALAESLGAINKPSSGFSPEEQAAVARAHVAAVSAFESLNTVICDQGNEHGFAYFKSLMETGE